MKPKEFTHSLKRTLKACAVVVKSALHLPQKHEDHFERLSKESHRKDIEIDGFSKLTAEQLAVVKKGVYDDILPYVEKGKILDFGCGTGRHLMNFPPERYERSGIDLNEGSLIRARAKLPDATFYNVNLLKDDSFIAWSKESYDLIYSVSVLQYFQKWELKKLFEKFFQILNFGGVAHMLFPTPKDLIDKWAIDKYRKYSIQDIRGLLVSSGFTILHAHHLSGVDNSGRVLAQKK